ncbi:HpcH/HpaI aldolase/citrate lyase family protein [Metabacillus sp. RGM 3146]|uniref:HpcH/HpaI aldolase/citrate lyase family protein n=1 Tax=Metabacillus sp. RGM 3146 TaxID=3401092 RepID=UPI003B9B32AA
MKHFHYLPNKKRKEIFFLEPAEFFKETDKELLSYALGAALYMPGSRQTIAKDVLSGKYLNGKHEGLTSMVICLEDSIGDGEVLDAENNIAANLTELYEQITRGRFSEYDLPLIFVRVREPVQMKRLAEKFGPHLSLLTGFIFPKVDRYNVRDYFFALRSIADENEMVLYGMPILETSQVIYRETRLEELLEIKYVLDEYRKFVLNVRLGGTDFSGLYGIRRSRGTTIYDISVIRDCITDIINIFGRSDNEYVISGPVWEYFGGRTRFLKPQLRQTPFQQASGDEGLRLRKDLIHRYDDGLIHEILLDNANGLVGKTIIHPSHIKLVNALGSISMEEYLDASSILAEADTYNGVIKSEFSNKMNEIKPHYNWARKIMLKSKIYGVFHENQSFIELISETAAEHAYI